ncbi:multidrug resistance protein 1A-like [Pomacea canaliculata]|nr:multidrug resistance protein 1A-like [Pomacea canaliculata]XP_025093408.1 multidrug resistance protein 1A-like [Pomacea canaliculata]
MTSLNTGRSAHREVKGEETTKTPAKTRQDSADVFVEIPETSPDRKTDKTQKNDSKLQIPHNGSTVNGHKGDVVIAADDDDGKSGCCGRKKKETQKTVGALELFRFAGPLEIVMMVVGMFGSVVAGCGLPLNMIVFGDVVDMFIDSSKIANATNRTYADVLMEKMSPNTMYFLVLATVVFVTSTMAVSLWTMAGERQIVHIRKRFFRSIMRQDIGWFDTHEASELNSRFSA